MNSVDKNGMSINKDDMIDIFSGSVEKNNKTETEKEKLSSVNMVSGPKDAEIKSLPDLNPDMLKRKEATPFKIQNQDGIVEIISVVNEITNILKSELKKFINEKLIDNMLLKSLEKAALKSYILKNTNWNTEGALRTDGTIDIERVLKNSVVYKDEIKNIDEELEISLFNLITIRFNSIKAGLDKEKYKEFLINFNKKKNVMEQGYKKPVVDFMNEKILNKIIKGCE